MHRSRYLLGLLTLALALAGVWFLWHLLGSSEDRPGLQLRVEFRDARGLRPGADVRYRGVTVGAVRSVQITEDGSKATVDLLIEPAAAVQARVNSSFWIVSPRFSGLASGATGLDTLVRDAYVAFLTPADRGSPLLPGSLIGGAERPPPLLEPESLDPLRHGDLLMTLLVPENHGLRPGSPVVFRGTNTGDVRSVELAEDGSHVAVQLRIAHRYRRTVTDQSEFWIARPYVTGALFSGFTVSDVTALVSPFVNYHSEPGRGVPVEDGYRVAATAARPEVDVGEVPKQALAERPPPGVADDDPLVLVRIVYAAVEEDSLSADDPIHQEGSGVLFLDRNGRAAVFTTRSITDGSYTTSDTFGGDPEIAQEQIKVLVPQGPVLRAHRIWVAPDGRDLAVLMLDEGAPPDLRVTPAALFDFEARAAETVTAVRSAREDGVPHPPAPLRWPGEVPPVDRHRGGAVMAGERVVAILGQPAARTDGVAITGLDVVPADLRPRP